VELSGMCPLAEDDIFLSSSVSGVRIPEIMNGLVRAGKVFRIADAPPYGYVSAISLAAASENLKNGISFYHEKYPDRPGVSVEELKSFVKIPIPDALLRFAVKALVERGQIAVKEDLLRMPDFAPEMDVDAGGITGKVQTLLSESGLTPPSVVEMSEKTGTPESIVLKALESLIKRGACEKTRDGLYFDAASVRRLEEKLTLFLRERGEITTQEFKELAGVSRKYAIPLIEHFDAKKVTLRIGDKRRLRKSN